MRPWLLILCAIFFGMGFVLGGFRLFILCFETLPPYDRTKIKHCFCCFVPLWIWMHGFSVEHSCILRYLFVFNLLFSWMFSPKWHLGPLAFRFVGSFELWAAFFLVGLLVQVTREFLIRLTLLLHYSTPYTSKVFHVPSCAHTRLESILKAIFRGAWSYCFILNVLLQHLSLWAFTR